MNSNNIVGRLTSKPELRTTESGKTRTSFSVAVDDGYGEEKKTYFIPCVAWNKQADNITKYCDKGSMVAIEGKTTTRTYETQEGRRFLVEVLVEKCTFLGKPLNQMKDAEVVASVVNNEKVTSDPFEKFGNEIEISDDDLPF